MYCWIDFKKIRLEFRASDFKAIEGVYSLREDLSPRHQYWHDSGEFPLHIYWLICNWNTPLKTGFSGVWSPQKESQKLLRMGILQYWVTLGSCKILVKWHRQLLLFFDWHGEGGVSVRILIKKWWQFVSSGDSFQTGPKGRVSWKLKYRHPDCLGIYMYFSNPECRQLEFCCQGCHFPR